MLRGNLDIVGFRQFCGWVQDSELPESPVSLVITDNGTLLHRVLANRYRDDLEQAGIGNGRHAFDLTLDRPLSPLERHEISIRCELDGRDLPGSPLILEPSRDFNASVQDYLGDVLTQLNSADAIARAIDYLAGATATLMQRLAERQSRRAERDDYRQYLRRWRQRLVETETATTPAMMDQALRRALVIDDRLPKGDRDADRMPSSPICNRSSGSATKSCSWPLASLRWARTRWRGSSKSG